MKQFKCKNAIPLRKGGCGCTRRACEPCDFTPDYGVNGRNVTNCKRYNYTYAAENRAPNMPPAKVIGRRLAG